MRGNAVRIHLEGIYQAAPAKPPSDSARSIFAAVIIEAPKLGTYTAHNGVLTGASIRQVGTRSSPNAPAPPSGVILAPNGGYYREGEFCRNVDAGRTTEDAEGRVMTCVLESGRYHWHL